MARIAVGGFHHETNCFVEPKTDYAYFASIATGRRSCAERRRASGLPTRASRCPDFSRDGEEHESCRSCGRAAARAGWSRAMRSSASRAKWSACSRGRCRWSRLSRPSRRGGDRGLRGSRRRAPAPRSRGRRRAVPIVISLDYHANVTPADGRGSPTASSATGPIRTSIASRPASARRASMTMMLERGRPAGRALRGCRSSFRSTRSARWSSRRESVVERRVARGGDRTERVLSRGLPARRPQGAGRRWSCTRRPGEADEAADGCERDRVREAELRGAAARSRRRACGRRCASRGPRRVRW